jgi:hypothetical protein
LAVIFSFCRPFDKAQNDISVGQTGNFCGGKTKLFCFGLHEYSGFGLGSDFQVARRVCQFIHFKSCDNLPSAAYRDLQQPYQDMHAEQRRALHRHV